MAGWLDGVETGCLENVPSQPLRVVALNVGENMCGHHGKARPRVCVDARRAFNGSG